MHHTSAGQGVWHVGQREVVRFRSLSMRMRRGDEIAIGNGSFLKGEVDAGLVSISTAAHAADEQNSDRDRRNEETKR